MNRCADLATTDDLYLNGTAAAANEFNGHWYQMRIYDSYLDLPQATKIWRAKPQSMTMKFGGKVWKVDDGGTAKKVVCNGFGAILLNTYVTSTLLTGTTVFTNGSERNGNVFIPDPTNHINDRITSDDIFGEVVGAIGSTNEYICNFENNTTPQGEFVAEGLFIDIIKVVFNLGSTNDSRTFNVSARKVIIIDKIHEINNMITTSNFRLLDTGKDTTKLVNHVVVIGRGETRTVIQTSDINAVAISDTG